MAIENVPTVIKKRQPQILVEYQREMTFPWFVAGVCVTDTQANKLIKRLIPLMGGKPSFRTR